MARRDWGPWSGARGGDPGVGEGWGSLPCQVPVMAPSPRPVVAPGPWFPLAAAWLLTRALGVPLLSGDQSGDTGRGVRGYVVATSTPGPAAVICKLLYVTCAYMA